MAKVPFECPSSDQGLDADVNKSACVNRAEKTRRRFLLLGGAALAASIVGISDRAEAKSRFSAGVDRIDYSMVERSLSLKWEQLIKMSLPELEEKLNKMDASDVKKTLESLFLVVDEIDQVVNDDIDEKLKKKEALNESEKEFFLKLAKKYRPKSLSLIEHILKKERLGRNDFQFLFIEFRHFVTKERDIVIALNFVRTWAIKKGYLGMDEKRNKEYRQLQEGLEKYKQWLNKY